MNKDANSFDCTQYLDTFLNILNPKFFSTILDSQLEIEVATINAIICVGEILTSKFVIKNDIKYQIFSKPQANYYDFIIILKNIIDLPVIYPKIVRCCAIKQIGNIVRRINNTKDAQFIKTVYEYADDFSQRLLSTAKISKEFIISYLNALGKMAIDLRLQQILLGIIEKYIRSFNTFDLDTKISICKTVIYLKQPSSEILNFFKKLSQLQDAPLSLSSYASLSFITLSLQIGNTINLNKLLLHIQEKKSLESTNEKVVSPSLKIINLIAIHSSNDQKKCLEILKNFAFGKSPVCRHQALKLAGKIAKKIDDHVVTRKVLKTCVTHISNYLNGKTDLVKSIANTAATVGMQDTTHANQIFHLFESIFNQTYDIPQKIFDYMTYFTPSILRTKTHIIDYSKEDIFENYIKSQTNATFSEDSELIIHLHKNLLNNKMQDQLLKSSFFLNPKFEIGYINISKWDIRIPEELFVYEDILSHFVLCCVDVFRTSTTIPAFQRAIISQKADSIMEVIGLQASTDANERVSCDGWDQIVSVLGPFAISNYVQLFFALVNDPEICDSPSLVSLIAELQFTKEYIDKRRKEKEINKNPPNIDKRSLLQKRSFY